MDVFSINEFVRGLSVSLDIETIAQMILLKLKKDLGAETAGIFYINKERQDLFLYHSAGRINEKTQTNLVSAISEKWQALDSRAAIDPQKVELFYILTPELTGELNYGSAVFVPMMTMGNYMGLIFADGGKGADTREKATETLHVISSVSAPVIDNGYRHKQVEEMARTDGLTGIHNHRSFHEHLDRELSSARRRKQPVSLAIFDIDDFKKINDTFGHQVGDEVLRQLANKVQGMIRKEDIFARYGGEEFSLIFPNSGLEGSQQTMERIREGVASTAFLAVNPNVRITLSAGLDSFSGHREIQKDKFIDNADNALYRAKDLGKNRISIYEKREA